MVQPVTSPSPRARDVPLRRVLTLLLMTLVAPGSAQLVCGHRRLGRAVLRLYVAVLVVLAVVAIILLVHPTTLLAPLTDPSVLTGLRIGLFVLAAGWFALFVDAWRLGRPHRLGRAQRLTATGATAFLSVVTVGALLLSAHYVSVAHDSITSIFAGGGNSTPNHGRYNVLLLGSDAGRDRIGLRPDSMTLLSIDAKTGNTAMFGLPRNLEQVPFPAGTVMHAQFPAGFSCPDNQCLLNAVYTWASTHRNLFPGVADPGMLATTQAVRAVTGLAVNYYVIVDLQGFTDLVNAVGGITIDVKQQLPIGGEGHPITGYIRPGVQHMDGFTALWYSRSRASTNDYARMARQRCVMAAMLHQLEPATVLTKFQAIATAGQHIAHTDIPASKLPTFLDLATKAKHATVLSVQFVPPLVDTGNPDFPAIRAKVRATIAATEAGPAARPTHRAGPTPPTSTPTPTPAPTASAGAATVGVTTANTPGGAPVSGSLSEVCAAR